MCFRVYRTHHVIHGGVAQMPTVSSRGQGKLLQYSGYFVDHYILAIFQSVLAITAIAVTSINLIPLSTYAYSGCLETAKMGSITAIALALLLGADYVFFKPYRIIHASKSLV